MTKVKFAEASPMNAADANGAHREQAADPAERKIDRRAWAKRLASEKE